ncbi:MAG: hypothetical protein U9Q69_02175 [Nanoarchaeota archaeon]|nr:hypothetical protein [Nanoarchaeota archaeon]
MKRGTAFIAFLMALPLVSAKQGAITEGFQFLFGQSNNEIVLKLGLFIVLLALFKSGFTKLKLFEEHPNYNLIVGAIFALISVKFMPVIYSNTIGSLIWVFALFFLPYTLIGLIIQSKGWKIFLTGLIVIGIYYLVTNGGFGFWGTGGALGSRYPYLGFIRGNELFDDVFFYLTFNKWFLPLLLLIALVVFLFYKGKIPSLKGRGEGGFLSNWGKNRTIKYKAKQERKAREKEAEERRKAEKEKKEGFFSKRRKNRAVKYKSRQERKAREKEAEERRKAEEAPINAQEAEAKRMRRAAWRNKWANKLKSAGKASAEAGWKGAKGAGQGIKNISDKIKGNENFQKSKDNAKNWFRMIFGKKQRAKKEAAEEQSQREEEETTKIFSAKRRKRVAQESQKKEGEEQKQKEQEEETTKIFSAKRRKRIAQQIREEQERKAREKEEKKEKRRMPPKPPSLRKVTNTPEGEKIQVKRKKKQ